MDVDVRFQGAVRWIRQCWPRGGVARGVLVSSVVGGTFPRRDVSKRPKKAAAGGLRLFLSSVRRR